MQFGCDTWAKFRERMDISEPVGVTVLGCIRVLRETILQ